MPFTDHHSTYHFPVLAVIVIISVLLVFMAWVAFAQYRMRLKFEPKQQQFQQALLQAQVEIRDQTMKHISQELKDNLGQVASLVKINLCMLARGGQEQEKEKINESLELMRMLITDIKALSFSINHQGQVPLGFVESVKKETERVNKQGMVRMSYASKGRFPILEQGTEIFLFRMFQEMLSNTIQHAGATAANVEIDANPQRVNILYSDNGRGFDQSNTDPEGSGIPSLAKRCRLIGADLSIDTQPGQGTRIQISLPTTSA